MSLGGKCNVTHFDETVKEGENVLQGVCIDTNTKIKSQDFSRLGNNVAIVLP
jgi:hypothetical protein